MPGAARDVADDGQAGILWTGRALTGWNHCHDETGRNPDRTTKDGPRARGIESFPLVES